ncbi:MAG: HemK/PrmC family methyltransferase [Devosia sp.]|nr:HemK/PrmC family methyltransferase [Devosia sp.]
MGIDLEIGPNVLVPRIETELLGHVALELLESVASPVVVDMCCGSGNVGLGIAAVRPDVRLYGCDLTPETIYSARHNAQRLGFGDRATFDQGDMFDALAAHDLLGKADLVACNPPYISTHKLEHESAYLLEAEPREAFDAGPYGIAIHQRLIAEAAPCIRPGGWLVFEFGEGQERQVRALLSRNKRYASAAFHSDPSGIPRVAMAQRV